MTASVANASSVVTIGGQMLPADTPDELLAAIKRIADEETRWDRVIIETQRALEAAQRTVGDVVAASPLELQKQAKALATSRAELDVARLAHEAARNARRQAIRALYHAQAQELRDQAATLRNETVERKAKADQLLQELEAFEGVQFSPTKRLVEQNGLQREYLPITKTNMLLIRANELTAQAQALENKPPQDSGAIQSGAMEYVTEQHAEPIRRSGGYVALQTRELKATSEGSLADVLDQLAALAPTVVGPPSHQVIEYLTPLVQQLEAKRETAMQRGAAYAPIMIDLVWHNGEISERESRVYFAGE